MSRHEQVVEKSSADSLRHNQICRTWNKYEVSRIRIELLWPARGTACWTPRATEPPAAPNGTTDEK